MSGRRVGARITSNAYKSDYPQDARFDGSPTRAGTIAAILAQEEDDDVTNTSDSPLLIDARGEVGADDPIQAADDALREFPADEIVFAVHAGAEAGWLEQGVVEAAETRYDVPVTHLTVGAG